jgi:hypothetical protein
LMEINFISRSIYNDSKLRNKICSNLSSSNGKKAKKDLRNRNHSH